jgi:hypothetical protein
MIFTVKLEALGEALLDFTKPEDLEEWLRSRCASAKASHLSVYR